MYHLQEPSKFFPGEIRVPFDIGHADKVWGGVIHFGELSIFLRMPLVLDVLGCISSKLDIDPVNTSFLLHHEASRMISVHHSIPIAVGELRYGTINKQIMPCKHVPYTTKKNTNMLFNILNSQKKNYCSRFVCFDFSFQPFQVTKTSMRIWAVTVMASTPSWGHRLRNCSGFWKSRSLAVTIWLHVPGLKLQFDAADYIYGLR